MTREKGFTLVELIIVIAVIGVLAAILIPVFSNVIEKSNRKSALSDARNALTHCINGITDAGLDGDTDLFFAVRKGGKIYVFGYTPHHEIMEYPDTYDGSNVTTAADMEAKTDEIINDLASIGMLEQKINHGIVQSEIDSYQTIVNPFKTDALIIRTDYQFTSTFIINSGMHTQSGLGGTTQSDNTNPGSDPGGTDPVTPAGINLTFSAGSDSGATNLPADQTNLTSGQFVTIPDDVIPHSATLVQGETNASAFTCWMDGNGTTYYPGDAFKITENTELMAQWESGYRVLWEADDWSYVFTHLSEKYIVGNSHPLWNMNSACMFPLGYDDNMMMWTGTFTGVIDGAGYIVSNLNCSYTGSACPAGLIYQNSGTVRNLNLKINGLYSKGYYLAGAVCINNATGVVRNVDVTYGNRTGAYYTASYGDIYCTIAQTNKKPRVGGVCALNKGLISGCSATGITMTSYDYYMGGIAAENTSTGTIEKCTATGMSAKERYSYGGDSVGGLVGYNTGDIRCCVCTGFITNLGNYTTPVGGMVGTHAGGNLANCYVDWSANTIAPTSTGYYYAGVIAGAVKNNAVVESCVGIGRDGYTNSAFYTFPGGSETYTATNIKTSYIVGIDSRNLVSIITADDLGAGRSILAGLDTDFWDFSAGASIPTAN